MPLRWLGRVRHIGRPAGDGHADASRHADDRRVSRTDADPNRACGHAGPHESRGAVQYAHQDSIANTAGLALPDADDTGHSDRGPIAHAHPHAHDYDHIYPNAHRLRLLRHR